MAVTTHDDLGAGLPGPDFDFPAFVRSKATMEDVLNPGLYHWEAFNFRPPALEKLEQRVRTDHLPTSIHHPLTCPPDYPHPPLLGLCIHPEREVRERALALIEENLSLAQDWGARYVVLHFGGGVSGDLGRRKALSLAMRSAERLAEMVEEYGVPILLEYAGYDPDIERPEDWAAIAQDLPPLGICLDIGHLFHHADLYGTDYLKEVEVLAPHTRALHLWNSRGISAWRKFRHVPVHPSLDPADGWIDIPTVLRIVLEIHPRCPIVFEPDFLYNDSESFFREGMEWVLGLVQEITATG